jgi:hypothetical protein
MRALVVGSITRDTNIFDGVAQHTFGGTALYAARTYLRFGIDVTLISRLAAADEPLIAKELAGVRLGGAAVRRDHDFREQLRCQRRTHAAGAGCGRAYCIRGRLFRRHRLAAPRSAASPRS